MKKQTIIFILIWMVYFLFFILHMWLLLLIGQLKVCFIAFCFQSFSRFRCVAPQTRSDCHLCYIWPDMWPRPLAHSRPGWRSLQRTSHLPQVYIPVCLRRRGGCSLWGRGGEWPCVHCPSWAWTDPRSPLWISGCTASLMESLLVFWTM